MRVLAEAANEAFDAPVHCGGEEEGLTIFGHIAEDNLHVLAEAHVEHAVGLVEDAKADGVGAESLATQVIHHAAGCADDDMGTFAQGAHLAVDRCATINGNRGEALERRGETIDLLTDLHRQFTRRAKDEHLRLLESDIDHVERG